MTLPVRVTVDIYLHRAPVRTQTMNIKLIMLMESLRAFVKREDGASAIEYAVIAGLISVVVIVAAGAIGTDLGVIMDNIKDAISTGADQSGRPET